MHISGNVCKICLKELGILLKCRETFEKFLGACNSSKTTGLQQFFSEFSDNCILRESIFQKVPIMNSKLPDKLVVLTSKATFSKKVNSMKYPVQTYTLVRTWNLLFTYFTGVSH